MELNMFCAAPNETIMTELYGWGEVPFDWVAERVQEFDTQKESQPNDPLVMTSFFNGTESNDWNTLFVIPADPKEGAEETMVANILRRVGQMPSTLFKIEHIHAGVRCIAFM